MSRKDDRRFVVVDDRGPPCPRCGKPTEVRAHAAITAFHLEKSYYYQRWYYCHNKHCRTSTIMPDEHRVFRNDPHPFV